MTELGHGGEVDRGVLADRGVRTAADAPPRSSRLACKDEAAISSINGLSAAMVRWPSVWPMGMARTPAETILAVNALRQATSAGVSGTSCAAAAAATATG
jgi:hypothetical protein